VLPRVVLPRTIKDADGGARNYAMKGNRINNILVVGVVRNIITQLGLRTNRVALKRHNLTTCNVWWALSPRRWWNDVGFPHSLRRSAVCHSCRILGSFSQYRIKLRLWNFVPEMGRLCFVLCLTRYVS